MNFDFQKNEKFQRDLEYFKNSISYDKPYVNTDGAPLDSDTSAMTIHVLQHSNQNISLEDLLKFYHTEQFLTFFGETNNSLSTNLDCLICL